MDKFFTLAVGTDRFDSEQEEWLRYGRRFIKEVDDDTDTMDC